MHANYNTEAIGRTIAKYGKASWNVLVQGPDGTFNIGTRTMTTADWHAYRDSILCRLACMIGDRWLGVDESAKESELSR